MKIDNEEHIKNFKTIDRCVNAMEYSVLGGSVSLVIYALGRYVIGDDYITGEILKYMGAGTALLSASACAISEIKISRIKREITKTPRKINPLEEKLK